jgi:hypothetical protein
MFHAEKVNNGAWRTLSTFMGSSYPGVQMLSSILIPLLAPPHIKIIYRFETAWVKPQFPRSFFPCRHNFRTQWRFSHLLTDRSGKAD